MVVRKVAAKPVVGEPGPTTQGPLDTAGIPSYEWAVNANKLNRAKAYVKETTPGLKGKDLEAAVKDRYVQLQGLLHEERAARPTRATRGAKASAGEQNLAQDDGSTD